MDSESKQKGYLKEIPAITWVMVVFALLVLAGGLTAMAFIRGKATAGAITALVTAVLGVVGTHVGHVAGHQLATKQGSEKPPAGSSKLQFATPRGSAHDGRRKLIA
jgi:fatty acid desaturase